MQQQNHTSRKPVTPARIAECVTGMLAILLFCGIQYFFRACDAREDGTWMTCHWAERAVFAMALAIFATSLVLVLFFRKRDNTHGIKAGLSIAVLVQSLVCMMIPGGFIPLCMMDTMRCHTVMRPAVTVICLLLAVSAGVTFGLHLKLSKANHVHEPSEPPGA